MFEIEGNSLVFRNGRRHKFSDTIAEVLTFDDSIVIRVGSESSQRTNRNVYAFDFAGNVLWQIPERTHMTEHSPYVGLYRKDLFVEAFNWDGSTLVLHPKSGLVLSEGIMSGEYRSRARRPRPTKSYM